jgi:hypothetical protein
MNYALSSHARVRMQQRAISPEALELVLEHGKSRYDHRGARVVFLPKQLQRKLLAVLAPATRRRLEKQLRTYLVCAAESAQVITVGYRHQRLVGH